MNLFENLQIFNESENKLVSEFKEFLSNKNAQYIANEIGETKDGMQIVIYDGDWKHEHLYMKHLLDEFFTNKGIDISITFEEIGESDQDTFSAKYNVEFNTKPKNYTADVKPLKFGIQKEGTAYKRIASTSEFDNGHVIFNDWVKISDEEAEELAKQKSIENPNKIYYVKYDNIMNPCSDIKWKNGEMITEANNICLSEYEYIGPATGYNKGWSLYRKIVNGKGEWVAEHQQTKEVVPINYDQVQGFEPIKLQGIQKVQKDLGDMLLPKRESPSNFGDFSSYRGIYTDQGIEDIKTIITQLSELKNKSQFDDYIDLDSDNLRVVFKKISDTTVDGKVYWYTGNHINSGGTQYKWNQADSVNQLIDWVIYVIKTYICTRKLSRELGDMLLPKRESNNTISVEYTYDGDDISDYKGHVKVSTDNEETALNVAEKYIKNNHPEINPRNFSVSNDNYNNVDVIDINGKKLTESIDEDYDNDSSVNKKLIKKICDEFKYGPLVDAAYSSSFYTQNQQQFMSIPISSNSDWSDYNSYKKDLQKVFPKCDIYCIPDDYEILIDVTNLYQELRESNTEDYDDNAATFLDTLEKEVKEAAHKFMLSVGFPEDEADDYLSVSTDINDDYVMVSVGAELGYDSLSKLCDELNKVIEKHDKDAYFEPECPGRIVAYLFGVKNESFIRIEESNHINIEDKDYATGEEMYNELVKYLNSLDQIAMNGNDCNWEPSEFNAKNLNADGEIYLECGAYILIYPYINEWAEDYFRVIVIDAETCELSIQLKNGIERIFNKFKTDKWKLVFEG